MTEFSAAALSRELQATRQAFGYEYLRADYAPESVRARWQKLAAWSTGSMVRPAGNIREAAARELGPRMPGHE